MVLIKNLAMDNRRDLLYIEPNILRLDNTLTTMREALTIVAVELDFGKGNGILPAIVQDYKSGKVLMLAFMNREAWQLTLQTGEAHYWSRSRQELWHKGMTSGNIQIVKEVVADCDHDAILLKVEQIGGAACHLGYESCFHNRIDKRGDETIIGKKVFDPRNIYKK
jgi:phosphoribosyl-AMP cyclohydrolase